MPGCLLTFDIGTTGVKAGVFSAEGQLLGAAYREYGVKRPHPQWVEQSPTEMWLAQCKVCRELIASASIPVTEIAAIGISSQRATFVPVDRNEEPLTDFIGWQDKRSVSQCDQIRDVVGAEHFYQITGLPADPTAAVSKILWIKEKQPAVFEKTYRFASTQNVHLRQLGIENSPCDLPDAAYMGLLDVDRLTWSDEILQALGIPREKLPDLAPSGLPVGELSRQAAEQMGLKAGIPVVIAGGDLQVAGVGLGVNRKGTISVGIGTGGGVLIYLEKPLRHPTMAMNCLPHAVPGAWEMEGICLSSGAAYKWLRDTLGPPETTEALSRAVDPYDRLNEMAAKVSPGADGVIIMPSFMGAGSPNWYPHARGVVLGLTPATEKSTLVRAMLEGICLEIRWMLEEAKNLGTPIEEVRIWGGAAKSSLWNQIAADVYGFPAVRMESDEGGLVGAAILAGCGIGMFQSTQEGGEAFIRIKERYEPDPQRHAVYNSCFDIYRSAYSALAGQGVFKKIVELEGNHE